MNQGGYRLGHRPHLDGLRAVAVLLVLMGHAQVPGAASAGMVGVTVFFVLSGFLITRLLLEEQERAGRVDLRAFYLRRLRRLAPALVVMVAAATVMSVSQPGALVRAAAALTYTSNVVGVTHDMGPLLHTWSLAMEEQFYLAWPLAMVWVGRRWPRALLPLLGVCMTAVAVNRLVLMLHGASTYRMALGPDTRSDALLAGCALALLMPRITRFRLGRSAVGGAVVLAGAAPSTAAAEPVLLVAVTLAAVTVVAWGATTTSGSILISRPALYVGQVSYGVYLWHYPLTVVLLAAGVGWLPNLASTVLFSLAMATLSWRCVESPLLARRRPAPAAQAVTVDAVAA